MSGAGSPIEDRRSCASWSRRAFAIMAATALAACSGTFNPGDPFSAAQPVPAGVPPQPGAPSPAGAVRVGLILPLSAGGNAGAAAQAMRSAAEMAIAEFNASNLQLLTKDDAGTAAGAQAAAREAIDEGA
jgi:ABC-type branched-subunit amino acid transport system substrate-binding protein